MNKHYWSYVANVVLFALLASDHKINTKNKLKYRTVCEANKDLSEKLTLSQAQVDYLLKIVNKHGEIDEFDKIALTELNFKVPSE